MTNNQKITKVELPPKNIGTEKKVKLSNQKINSTVAVQSNIEFISITKSDWKELRNISKRIKLPQPGIDYLSLLYGSIISLIISLLQSFAAFKENDYTNILFYGASLIVLLIITCFVSHYNNKKTSQLNDDRIHLENLEGKFDLIEKKIES